MDLRRLEIVLLLQCGDRLKSSESDVYRRQILTTKVDPSAVRVNRVSQLLHYYHDYGVCCQVSIQCNKQTTVTAYMEWRQLRASAFG